jgi:protein-S-isoprenylcysteine O-methyltransferase Ste14
MNTTTTPDRDSTRGRGIPRRVLIPLGFFGWLVAIPLVHGVVPWALSRLAPRFGWTAGYPGTWNWLGLIPIAAGTAGLVWIFGSCLARIRELPERIQVLPPSILITYGPYAYTRNPMYFAALAIWLGWAILFGSVVVLIGFAALTVFITLVVPREERGLEKQFGETYRQYQARVPRWLARTRKEQP